MQRRRNSIPWLRGIQSLTVSVNDINDGGGKESTPPCCIERSALERYGAEMLRGVGLDSIGAMDKLGELRALQSEFKIVLKKQEEAPAGAKPRWERA